MLTIGEIQKRNVQKNSKLFWILWLWIDAVNLYKLLSIPVAAIDMMKFYYSFLKIKLLYDERCAN